MNPDVFITIAFCSYTVLAVSGAALVTRPPRSSLRCEIERLHTSARRAEVWLKANASKGILPPELATVPADLQLIEALYAVATLRPNGPPLPPPAYGWRSKRVDLPRLRNAARSGHWRRFKPAVKEMRLALRRLNQAETCLRRRGRASDDDLKATFLAALDTSYPSYRDLKRRFGWSEETFDSIVGQLREEGSIKTIGAEQMRESQYTDDEKAMRSVLLGIRPRWFGLLVYVLYIGAVWISILALAGATAFVGVSVDLVVEHGLDKTFDWSYPFFRWNVIALIVGLFGMTIVTTVTWVAAGVGGSARPGLREVLRRVTRALLELAWICIKLLLSYVPPVGGPPDANIPIRVNDPWTSRTTG